MMACCMTKRSCLACLPACGSHLLQSSLVPDGKVVVRDEDGKGAPVHDLRPQLLPLLRAPVVHHNPHAWRPLLKLVAPVGQHCLKVTCPP